MKTYFMTQVEGQIVSGNLVYGPLNFFVCSRPLNGVFIWCAFGLNYSLGVKKKNFLLGAKKDLFQNEMGSHGLYASKAWSYLRRQ